jgi:hypothetical protein
LEPRTAASTASCCTAACIDSNWRRRRAVGRAIWGEHRQRP